MKTNPHTTPVPAAASASSKPSMSGTLPSNLSTQSSELGTLARPHPRFQTKNIRRPTKLASLETLGHLRNPFKSVSCSTAPLAQLSRRLGNTLVFDLKTKGDQGIMIPLEKFR